jgi:hypothetical protein
MEGAASDKLLLVCAQRERSEQRQSELLLPPAGAVARPGKEMSRKCYNLALIPLVSR